MGPPQTPKNSPARSGGGRLLPGIRQPAAAETPPSFRRGRLGGDPLPASPYEPTPPSWTRHPTRQAPAVFYGDETRDHPPMMFNNTSNNFPSATRPHGVTLVERRSGSVSWRDASSTAWERSGRRRPSRNALRQPDTVATALASVLMSRTPAQPDQAAGFNQTRLLGWTPARTTATIELNDGR